MSPFRLLTVQFFRRFFDNDLVSPNGDGHEHLATILGLVAVPGLLASVFLLLQYTSPTLSPGERMLTALPHKVLLFGCSISVMALVTSIEWDALSLDARDHAILGPLPLSRWTVIRAKLAALTVFAALFAVAANAIPAVAFPLVFLSTVPIGFLRALWVFGAHASVSVLASAFGFVAMLALRETVRVILGPRLFRRVSAPLQFAAVLAFTSALLLLPATPSRLTAAWLSSASGGAALPPMWFVGLEETLAAGAVLNAPGMAAPTPGRFWTVGRDRRARAEYQSHTDTFGRLARLGATWLLASTALGLVAFLAGTRREPESDTGAAGGGLRVPLQRVLANGLARDPQRQAGLFFTLQTLARSAEHRLHLAAYLAAGAATSLVLLGPTLIVGGPRDPREVPTELFALQMILSFFVVAGLKAGFARPASLTANWIFQLSWTGDERRYHSGVRRAVATILGGLMLLLMPVHALWLDARSLAAHAVVGWIAALILAEVAAIEPRRIPFTCATISTGSLKKWWPAYLLAFLTYTFGLSALERQALRTTQATALLLAALAMTFAAVVAARRVQARRAGAVAFEEQPDVTQELGLGRT